MNPLVILLSSVCLGGQPELAWKQTAESTALVRGEQVVWQLNHKKGEEKSCFHPLCLGGQALTDFRPADHQWHRAAWFSWKTINGLLYWEEDAQGRSPGVNELVSVKAQTKADHSARFELQLTYHPPGKPAVLSEKRVLEVSAPDSAGGYAIDWQSTFRAGKEDVVLDRTPIAGEPGGVAWGGYAGLSLRLVPELRSWQFVDADGPAKGTNKDARWMSFGGKFKDGQAAIVVFDHPKNPRHPTPWYLIQGMPYFSPALVYRSPMKLPAGEDFTLRYRMKFQTRAVDRAATQADWERWSRD